MPLRISFCPSCEWEHDGEDVTGMDEHIETDKYGRQFYVCQLTKKKVYLEDATTFDGGRQDLD